MPSTRAQVEGLSLPAGRQGLILSDAFYLNLKSGFGAVECIKMPPFYVEGDKVGKSLLIFLESRERPKEEMDKEWKNSLDKVDEIRKGHKSILDRKLEKVKDLYR